MINNEPDEIGLLSRSSLIHLPTCETKSTPEELLADLIAELFYPGQCGGRNKRNVFGPYQSGWRSAHSDDKERFLLNVGRGRFKLTTGRKSPVDYFYAPIFPGLAREGAIKRKSGANIINGLLIKGVWANGLLGSDISKRKEFSKTVVMALVGDKKKGDDIFKQAAPTVTQQEIDGAITNLSGKIEEAEARPGEETAFAKQAVIDFVALMKLEPDMPRPLWIQQVMCYLRIVICLWALRYTKSMSLLKKHILQAYGGDVPSPDEIKSDYLEAPEMLLQISSSYDESIRQLIEVYQRDRVEVFEFLQRLDESDLLAENLLTECRLVVSGGNYPNEKTIDMHDFFTRIKDVAPEFSTKHAAEFSAHGTEFDISVAVASWAGKWVGHQKPAQNSPKTAGTNLRYLLNCSRKSSGEDERASHLFEIKRSKKILWRAFPGALAIQLFVHFADCKRDTNSSRRISIGDLFEHLTVYQLGTETENGSSAILDSLASLGLLVGSPDAGSSLPLQNPLGES